MRKIYLLSTITILFVANSFAQQNNLKKLTVTAGTSAGFATSKTKSPRPGSWLQFSYALSNHFAIATDFSNVNYKLPGDLPYTANLPNEMKLHGYYFSLLGKYLFNPQNKLQCAVAAGWSYAMQYNDYLSVETVNDQQFVSQQSYFSSEFEIPIATELSYPLAKNLRIQAKVQANIASYNISTIAAGAGISLNL